MRYIIVCSFFLAIISGCTLEVVREAGKAIKSIDTTINSGKVKKTSKKMNVSAINLIGKEQEQLFSMLGEPKLIREDGNVISMRFDQENCFAYTYFSKNSDIKKVEYFEVRTKKGDLLEKESDIYGCLNKFIQS